MYYEPSDLLWVKNVKRDNGRDWAFFETDEIPTFDLTFSKPQLKQAKRINCGEIILLFQRVNKVPGIRKRTYLTHLVTPIENVIHQNIESGGRFQWRRKVLVIARADLNQAIVSNSSEINFKRVGFGRPDSIKLLNRDKSLQDIQKHVWSLFKGHFIDTFDDFNNDYPESFQLDHIPPVLEGGEVEVLKKHVYRERDRAVIQAVKARALRLGNGRIRCECCQLDFVEMYGELALGFIECHHKYPIHKGERETDPDNDFALVCSNCHRMLHRKMSRNTYHSIKTLKDLVDKLRK